MLTEAQQQEVIRAIQQAERNTSGEIRVHVEQTSSETDVLKRTQNIFAELNMQETASRNAILIYVALQDRKFAIWGDKGINEVVPENFWESTRDIMREHLRQNDLVGALTKGVLMAGQQLKTYFPFQKDNLNELPDDISFG
ncbi:MAG: TPM domain-containing protein [Siphonobacter sp.]